MNIFRLNNIKEIESKISSILSKNPNEEIIMLLFMLLGGMDDNFRLKTLDYITDEMKSPSGKSQHLLMLDIMLGYLNDRLKK